MVSRQLKHEDWQEALNQNASWWPRIAEVALQQLQKLVPESHSTKELTDSRLSWSSNDPILNSLEFLDTLLAIDHTSPFDHYQDQLVSSIATAWENWPTFTRATALSCLRPWYWANFSGLRAILSRSVTDSEPLIVRYAIERTSDLAYSLSTPELTDFLTLASTGGHERALHHVAQLMGDAFVMQKGSDNEHVHFVAKLVEHAMTIEWSDSLAHQTFLNGLLVGSSEAVQILGPISVNIDSWFDLIQYAVRAWPFCQTESCLNIHTIFKTLGLLHDEGAREELFVRLRDVWNVLMSRGELAEFCDLHFEVMEVIKGPWIHKEGNRIQEKRLVVNAAVEDVLASICRASAERVSEWKRASKTTDDLGWQSGLDGRDSAALIELCIEAFNDKAKARRNMKPVIDILADAGATEVAAKLYAVFRSV